jgi:UPF0755 protein
MLKKMIYTFILLVTLAGGLAFWFGADFIKKFATTPVPVAQETVVELRRGEGLRNFAEQLQNAHLISSSTLFYYWLRLTGGSERFQSGKYAFSGDITPIIIRDKLQRGDVYRPIALSFTIPEGFTMKQFAERLAAKGLAPPRDVLTMLSQKDFLQTFSITGPTAEGFLYPATYNFEELPKPKEVVKKVVGTFFEKLPSDYERLVKEKGLTLYQAVTFASLIELETMQESEKPQVAEVIWRRLKKSENLGIDAAIIYGIPNYTGDITWDHLKDTKNPYNTRVHKGLPPTPIGSPSLSSLTAVLNPTNFGYYYYMLDASDHTKHVFSKTQTEHNANVQRYLKSIPKR